MARSTTRIAGGLSLVAVLAVTVIGPVQANGGGSSGPSYRADVTPSTIAAGTSTQQVLTVTQRASGSDLRVGSFRIDIPADLSVTAATAKRGTTALPAPVIASGTVTVNSVGFTGSNQTAKVTLTVAAACGVGNDRTWGVTARKASSFTSGSGALSQDTLSQLGTAISRCSLDFVTQPASAGRNKVITSVEADPDGEPIKVRVLDGNGAAADASDITVDLDIVPDTGADGAILGADSADTNGHGVATFAPTIDTSERGYQLRATADGIIGTGASLGFDINDVAKHCSGDCSGQSDKGTTSAAISLSSNGGILTMSLGLDALDCNDAANHFYTSTSAPVTWNITTSGGRVEVTIRLAAADVTRPYNLYDFCFVSPSTGFRNRYNIKIKAGQPGLLKICPPRLDPEPCVLDKWRDGGDVFVRASIPAGDPRGRI